jgi:hypothetical protein
MSTRALVSLALLPLVVSCGRTSLFKTRPGMVGQPASTDGSTGPDGGSPDGPGRADVMEPFDGTVFKDASEPDTGLIDGGPIPCVELSSCCGELPPQFQMLCQNIAQTGTAPQCTGALDMARANGLCLPDGGFGGDGGLGPECTALEGCCMQAMGRIGGRCMRTAQQGNEAVCQQFLQFAGPRICPNFDAGLGN